MSFYSWITVSSVNIVTNLWAGQPRNHVLIPGRGKSFSSPKHSHIYKTSSVHPTSYTGGIRNQAPPSNAEGRNK
jgi:hypothetical protein